MHWQQQQKLNWAVLVAEVAGCIQTEQEEQKQPEGELSAPETFED